MNEMVEDKTLFVTTPDQQRVLGLPEAPVAYHPREFVKLLGRAQLVHQQYAESAQAKKLLAQVADRKQAGIAQSVAVGVLSKVQELGERYDEAVQEPYAAAPETSTDEVAMPEMFAPHLTNYFTMAAARRIAEVRQAQELEKSYLDSSWSAADAL